MQMCVALRLGSHSVSHFLVYVFFAYTFYALQYMYLKQQLGNKHENTATAYLDLRGYVSMKQTLQGARAQIVV